MPLSTASSLNSNDLFEGVIMQKRLLVVFQALSLLLLASAAADAQSGDSLWFGRGGRLEPQPSTTRILGSVSPTETFGKRDRDDSKECSPVSALKRLIGPLYFSRSMRIRALCSSTWAPELFMHPTRLQRAA